MKRTLKILIPILLSLAIILCTIWYLFIYDLAFTRDMLLNIARYNESHGNHSIAAWFYNRAYTQSSGSDEVAIELAEQYKQMGNYTKAEYTLTNAIADGGGVDLYIALSKTYIEQDKVLDAVNMLNNVTNPEIKKELEALRPEAPEAILPPGHYNQYVSADITAKSGILYVSTVGTYPSILTDAYTGPIPLTDGENTLYAVAVSERGLVSTLSIFGYNIGGVVKEMEFADAAVESEIRKLLDVPDDKVLFTNDLWTIKSFTIPSDAKSYGDLKHMPFLETLIIEQGVSAEIKNISGLTNLTELRIVDVSITQEDVKIIGSLPALKKLTLQHCRLTTIAPLSNLKSLSVLDLSNNTVRDIDAIREMVNLQELYLPNNSVTDLSAIADCTKLVKLDASSNALTSLSSVSKMTELTELKANTNTITDLGDMSKLTKLAVIQLKENNLSSIDGLATCTALTDLNIATNSLTDIGILASLPNLMYLDFSRNQVTEIPAFSTDCSLVSINGNHNSISSLTPLSGLKKLNKVYMDYNSDIKSLEPLVGCTLLIEVHVYETKVKDVTCLTNQSVIVNYKPV